MAVNNSISDGQPSHTVQFRYQSSGITFAQWVALFTLCFAPLLAHIIVGVPNYIHLHSDRPKWHDWIVHYNPNSIVWRYFAIIDRRIRARTWDDLDMAASNAAFWTTHGWDGSEAMLLKSREFCLQPPPPMLERLVSLDMLKTIIITLQGAQSIYGVLREWFLALDTIFAALAVFGLLRLPPALWLSSDYVMIDSAALSARRSVTHLEEAPTSYEMTFKPSISRPPTQPTSQYSLLDSSNQRNKFRETTCPQGLFIRAIYLAILIGLAILWLASAFPQVFNPAQNQDGGYSATSVLVIMYYGVFLLTAIILFIYYFITRRCMPSTTTIPCIATTWYKTYTCLLMVIMSAMIIVAALETRRTPCGTYTQLPPLADPFVCPEFTSLNSTGSA